MPAYLMKAYALLLLTRPHFLASGVLLYLIGVGIAFNGSGAVDLPLVVSGLLAVIFGQISGQISNDYWDRIGDEKSVRTIFSGGSGVLQAGRVNPNEALLAALISASISLFVALASQIFLGAGRFTWLLVVIGILGGWLYSMSPPRLVSTGFGEIVVAIVVGSTPVILGYYLLAGAISSQVLVVSLVMIAFLLPVVIAVEFPDFEADVASGKRNITVRAGVEGAARLYAILLFLPYLVVLVAIGSGWLHLLESIVLATVPLALLNAGMALGLRARDLGKAGTVTFNSMVLFVAVMILQLVYAFSL